MPRETINIAKGGRKGGREGGREREGERGREREREGERERDRRVSELAWGTRLMGRANLFKEPQRESCQHDITERDRETEG